MPGKVRPIPVPDLPTWDAANLRTPAHCCFVLVSFFFCCPPSPFFFSRYVGRVGMILDKIKCTAESFEI
ncbi:hypothetical protein PspLS_08087 [Pyricularia sp. CBS 133598]|nr:hypothetical protein PspLS_08087 [Pyricularia sp. CBS 133598]